MPNTLEFADLGEAIGNATAVLRNNAASAGLAVAVPTCPGWTMHDLLAHQGMVHRWAAAKVRDEPTRHDPEVLAEAAASDDLLQWLDDGMVDLLNALAGAPDDLEVPFFLMDAPAPRQAWTRRQAHETTIHGVDAMAARLGRAPLPEELWFSPALARDGIDELLMGFTGLAHYGLTLPRPARVSVQTDDGLGAWTIAIGPDGAVPAGGADPDADTVLTGSARGLYTGLWNRGDAFTTHGDPEPLRFLREQLRVAR